MLSNVYTKNEILEHLAAKGYYIDNYTLDSFFEQWKVEAIFEDEKGQEFYDKNSLDLIINNLFSASSNDTNESESKETMEKDTKEEVATNEQIEKETVDNTPTEPAQENVEQDKNEQENNNTTEEIKEETEEKTEVTNTSNETEVSSKIEDELEDEDEEEDENIEHPYHKLGTLEGAMQIVSKDVKERQEFEQSLISSGKDIDPDDMSLVSSSFEVQEKFKEYINSEQYQKDQEQQKNNELKLDISERALNLVARSLARKITKYVGSMYLRDVDNSAQLSELKEKNRKLEHKSRSLEEQNKKLKLLLAESNKNLNSYKPTLFGLYKKVPHKK